MLVARTEPLPIECVARGYLSGSGWKDYVATGEVCGIRLPAGLRESDRLPEPIFTPATKAQSGHDINISEEDAADLVGERVLERVRDLTLRLYAEGAAHAESCGIIVADTKFEFGLLPVADGDDRPVEERVILIDEVLTPDSSRFWPRDGYRPGGAQPSFDKQFVRDYLERIRWNKQPPVPSLPDDVVAKTREKYVEAFRRLTGRELDSDQRPARAARRRDGRQRRPVRRCGPRVREAVHRPRARPVRRQPDQDRRRAAACTATR